MKRLSLILAVFALFAASCTSSTVEGSSVQAESDDGAIESSSSADTTSTDSSTVPSSAEDDDDSDSSSEAKPPPEGPAAPDFTLALEPSGEFVLSQEVKPVYMIFWAEW